MYIKKHKILAKGLKNHFDKKMPLKYKCFKSILKDTSIALRDYIEQILKIVKNTPMKQIGLYQAKETLSENETVDRNIVKWFFEKLNFVILYS